MGHEPGVAVGSGRADGVIDEGDSFSRPAKQPKNEDLTNTALDMSRPETRSLVGSDRQRAVRMAGEQMGGSVPVVGPSVLERIEAGVVFE